MNNKIRNAYLLTLAGYLGLFFLLFAWIIWFRSEQSLPRSLSLLILVGPLLFPLRGLLNGKIYTYGWAHFMALFYFILGVGNATQQATLALGSAEILFSVMWFLGCVLYLRWQPN